jgi:hypothetical protein
VAYGAALLAFWGQGQRVQPAVTGEVLEPQGNSAYADALIRYQAS